MVNDQKLPRLPTRIVQDKRLAAVETLFSLGQEPYPYGMAGPLWSPSPQLHQMLQLVRGSGELILGLETIAETLAQTWPKPQTAPASCQFILLLAKDGSERFGIQARKLWQAWEAWGRMAHLDMTGVDIGQRLFKKDKEVRALLILGEAAITKFLLGLASGSQRK